MRLPCGIPRQIHLREKVVAACQAQTALRQQRIPPHEVGGRFKAGVVIAPEGRAATENAVQDLVPPGGQQIHGKARVVGEFPGAAQMPAACAAPQGVLPGNSLRSRF